MLVRYRNKSQLIMDKNSELDDIILHEAGYIIREVVEQ